jgi:hypothetical protein
MTIGEKNKRIKNGRPRSGYPKGAITHQVQLDASEKAENETKQREKE